MITLPSPTGGWNARDSLAEMPMNDAVSLINLVPNGDSVKTRPGYKAHSSDLGSNVQTLVTYHGATEKLICAEGGEVIDISSGSSGTKLGPAAGTFNSDKWQTTEFKNRIIFANGSDGVQDYDGTTWTATTITGATSADLIDCVTHQGRVLYVEKDSQSFWYPSAGAYAGAMTEFDLSEFTTTGGDLLTLISWTRDSGAGVDDLLVCVFDTGELIVYAGSDPGDANDWVMVGRFRIGAPLGRRCATNVGGDVIILTVDGYVPLSAAIMEGRYTEQSNFSFKIDNAAKEAAQAYGDNFGWESIYWPQASLFIVNVPLSSSQSHQHVRNTVKGGWCKFTGINALCWAVYDENLYFGSSDGYVYQIASTADAGGFIEHECVQAFQFFGSPGTKKIVTAALPITDNAYPEKFSIKFYEDFKITTLPGYSGSDELAPTEWDVATWDVSTWTGGTGEAKTARKNVVGNGFALSMALRFRSRADTTTWWATNLWLKKSGVV